MTKHLDEALKGHLPLESPKIETNAELVCDEALVICSGHVKPVPKIAPVKLKVKANVVEPKMDTALHKLYDLEHGCEAEKPVKFDLNLYQMEDY